MQAAKLAKQESEIQMVKQQKVQTPAQATEAFKVEDAIEEESQDEDYFEEPADVVESSQIAPLPSKPV